MRTARSLTSGEKLVGVFMAPYSQRLEPPRKPGRFRLTVIGKWGNAAQVKEWERSPNVRVLGFVPDIRDHVLQAEVSIVPMVSGSGIKNKILEPGRSDSPWWRPRSPVAVSSVIPNTTSFWQQAPKTPPHRYSAYSAMPNSGRGWVWPPARTSWNDTHGNR